jgi:hypothetical protein
MVDTNCENAPCSSRASKAVQTARTPIVSRTARPRSREIHRLIHTSVKKSERLSTIRQAAASLSPYKRAARAVSQLQWPDKDREEWFSSEENHEKAYRFPDLLQRGTSWEK